MSVSQSGHDGRGKERTLSVKFIAALESPPWSKSFNPSMSPIFAEARGQSLCNKLHDLLIVPLCCGIVHHSFV
jgi:hypothetical protein